MGATMEAPMVVPIIPSWVLGPYVALWRVPAEEGNECKHQVFGKMETEDQVFDKVDWKVFFCPEGQPKAPMVPPWGPHVCSLIFPYPAGDQWGSPYFSVLSLVG